MFLDDLLFIAPENDLLQSAQGNFARQLIVCVLHEPDFPQNKDFLEKILTAAKLNMAQDALYVEIAGTEAFSLLLAIQKRHARQVLVFGVPPKQLGLSIQVPLYQPFEFYGADFLFAEKLSLLEPDRDRKGRLWAALKAMFL